ncbi:MAG: bifunctional nuclease family protein [Chloroflexota bacterium]|nr:bifunctional nuclease family protein [Chloroflexota bacterium]MDE2859654.1 bifunctional nuclease family protein [Chloroflexota bacterium]
MIEMIVDRVQVSLMSQHRLVVLRDTQEERYLPIWIGAFESEAITLELQGMLRERPLTHDLLKATITEMGGAVRHIFINNLSKDVFYAQINIEVNGDSIDIDSRPSDAIALAVRLKAPIYVDKQVMDKAGIRPDRNVEPEILGLDDEFTEPSEKVDETKLSAFADFVDTLNLDDFDEDE